MQICDAFSVLLPNQPVKREKQMSVEKRVQPEKFSFSSSVKEDVWHPKSDAAAYEWWYFDALSDDGKDAVVVIFLDNFIFSPRYNALCRKQHKELRQKAKGKRQITKDESQGI